MKYFHKAIYPPRVHVEQKNLPERLCRKLRGYLISRFNKYPQNFLSSKLIRPTVYLHSEGFQSKQQDTKSTALADVGLMAIIRENHVVQTNLMLLDVSVI